MLSNLGCPWRGRRDALYDHEGHARYIGITAKCLTDRILKRHVGGDNNSHKFSTVYNAGRMFHARKAAASCPRDGKIAKELRRLFFCTFGDDPTRMVLAENISYGIGYLLHDFKLNNFAT